MDSTKWTPEGTQVAPYLVVRDPTRAIDFYKQAFQAREISRNTGPDGRSIVHAHVRIGNSNVFLTDEKPEWGSRSPLSFGGTPVSLYLYVEDADATFKRALSAGGKEKMAMQDAFWGDRWGMVEDPFGHVWQIATHQRDLTPEEIQKGMKEAMSKMAKPATV